MEGAYILVFIRNGANLAHFFSQRPMRKKYIIKKILAVRPVTYKT
jgi:hypothetical protein